MRPILASLFVLASAMIGPSMAMAQAHETEQAPEAHSIVGAWNFRSFTGDTCDFGGVAHLRAPDPSGVYPCELTARQVCSAANIEWVVRQSCIANRTDNRLIIRSTIEEFLVGDPTPAYWPDNFVLKIRSGDLMTGTLVSHGSHASEFTRQVEGMS
ncbi:MAG: hypothetical protein AAF829_05135 [Pseudomonadota bacterium]